MNTATQHHFKRLRAHQRNVFADGGGMLTTYPSGRTEHTFASAPYGEHALSAFAGAKAHVNFRGRLAKEVAEHKKRSRAAKKAAKTRKARA